MKLNPVITFLKFANVQMAAESLFGRQSIDLPGKAFSAGNMTAASLVDGKTIRVRHHINAAPMKPNALAPI